MGGEDAVRTSELANRIVGAPLYPIDRAARLYDSPWDLPADEERRRRRGRSVALCDGVEPLAIGARLAIALGSVAVEMHVAP